MIGGDSIGIAEVEETLERDRERKRREGGEFGGQASRPQQMEWRSSMKRYLEEAKEALAVCLYSVDDTSTF